MNNKELSSFGEVIREINQIANQSDFYDKKYIKPLSVIANQRQFVSNSQSFESGINIYEGFFDTFGKDVDIDVRKIISGINQQKIRNLQFEAQNAISKCLQDGKMKKEDCPNLIKMLTSDTLLDSIINIGLCYDWRIILDNINNKNVSKAEQICTRDWFLMRTFDYCFSANNIAEKMGVTLNEGNTKNMEQTIKNVMSTKLVKNAQFPSNLFVNFRREKNNEIVDIRSDVNNDLKKINNSFRKEQKLDF